jgi:hypothetical protein
MAVTALAWIPLHLPAQTSLNSLSAVVNVVAPEKIFAKRNATFDVPFTIQVKQGFHVNSHTPNDDYLIPLKFTFNAGPVEVVEVIFPKPAMQKFPFSDKPLSVFDGAFKTQAKLKTAGNAPLGPAHLVGKLRYQACNDRMCLPPRTLEIKVPVEIRN